MNVVYLTTLAPMSGARGNGSKSGTATARWPTCACSRWTAWSYGSVQLTSQAIGLLLDRGIDVCFLTIRGRLRGSLVSGASRNVFLRLAQFERWKDEAFRVAFSREVVAAS